MRITSICSVLPLLVALAGVVPSGLAQQTIAGQPVHGSCIGKPTAAAPPQQGSWTKCLLFNVPALKRLVVETVSYAVQVPASGFPSDLVFGKNAGPGNHLFFLEGSDPNMFTYTPVLTGVDRGTNVYRGTYLTRFYIEENQVLAAGVAFTAVAINNQSFAFSGYLVDK